MIRVASKCRTFKALLSDIKYMYYCSSLMTLELMRLYIRLTQEQLR
jgi:hypothetical protein